MRPNDRIGLDDGVDDWSQRTTLYGLLKPVERLPIRPDENSVKAEVAIDRLLEVARQLDNRAGRSALPDANEACGQQPMAGAVRNGVQRLPNLRHRSGNDIDLFAVEYYIDPEIA